MAQSHGDPALAPAEQLARLAQGLGTGRARTDELESLLARHPGDPGLHRLATAHFAANGQPGRALAHAAEAARLAPGLAAARHDLACLLAHAGRWPAAFAEFEAASRLQPDRADTWLLWAQALRQAGRAGEALVPAREAHRLAPDNERALRLLADLEFQWGFPGDALPLWQALATRHPDDPAAVLRHGECHSRLGQPGEARRIFAAALARDPGSAELRLALGQAAEDDGDRGAAASAYREALAQRPGWPHALACLLGLERAQAGADEIRAAEARLADPATPAADQALLGYALGKARDARGDAGPAIAHWHQANAARRREAGDFDAAAHRARVQATLDAFPPGWQAGLPPGTADERPVFIVGMPRSGTTLTEQVLAAHPAVAGCGELPDLALLARVLPARAGGAPWPGFVARLDADALGWARGRYLAAATRQAPPGALRLVDKEPMNFQWLGLASALFPQARVIWCRRDPRDVAVSIYGENFALGEPFATRFEGIAECINGQVRLMRHWQAVLPNPVLELQYEALATDFEAQVRRLLDFLGLPWDPACLDFHARTGTVQSPSRWQVRQPVHSRSIGRWKAYADHLGPLLDALEAPPAD